MTVRNLDRLDPRARGLKLHKHDAHDRLIACELVMFTGGAPSIDTILRRAALSGVVAVEPFDERMDYFADVFIDDNSSTQTILLDHRSYASLKNHWMRCRLVKTE